MTEPLTGYEATSVAEVESFLDDNPAASSDQVYLGTVGHSERAIAAVAAKRAGGGGATPFSVLGPARFAWDDPGIDSQIGLFAVPAGSQIVKAWAITRVDWVLSGAVLIELGLAPTADLTDWYSVVYYSSSIGNVQAHAEQEMNAALGVNSGVSEGTLCRVWDVLQPSTLVVSVSGSTSAGESDAYALIWTP